MRIKIESDTFGCAWFEVPGEVGACGDKEQEFFAFVGRLAAQSMEVARMFSREVKFTVDVGL